MKTLKNEQGLHIGFCGIDGSGKTTQAMLLSKWLKDNGINIVFYEEKRNFVSEITNILAKKNGYPTGRIYLGELLYMTCMSFEILRQNMLNIRPYTKSGTTIVSSRTLFDWLAGSIAKNYSTTELHLISEIMLLSGVPDIIIWLDTSPKIALDRIIKRQLDSANLAYLIKYQSAFKTVLQEYTHQKINGDNDIQVVQNEIKLVVENFISRS